MFRASSRTLIRYYFGNMLKAFAGDSPSSRVRKLCTNLGVGHGMLQETYPSVDNAKLVVYQRFPDSRAAVRDHSASIVVPSLFHFERVEDLFDLMFMSFALNAFLVNSRDHENYLTSIFPMKLPFDLISEACESIGFGTAESPDVRNADNYL